LAPSIKKRYPPSEKLDPNFRNQLAKNYMVLVKERIFQWYTCRRFISSYGDQLYEVFIGHPFEPGVKGGISVLIYPQDSLDGYMQGDVLCGERIRSQLDASTSTEIQSPHRVGVF
jgi:hypothetical protein